MKNIHNDYRCSCKKLLLKGFIFVGEIEIKCRFCKKTSVIKGVHAKLDCPNYYIFVTDSDGKILKSTNSALETTGYSAEEIKTKYVHDIITDIKDHMYEKIKNHLENTITRSLVFKGLQKLKNGTVSEVQVGVRSFKSQLDDQELFIFDIDQNIPKKLEKLDAKKL